MGDSTLAAGAANLTAEMKFKYVPASAAVDEQMVVGIRFDTFKCFEQVNDLKAARKKLMSRKVNDKSTSTEVRDALIAIQKDVTSYRC